MKIFSDIKSVFKKDDIGNRKRGILWLLIGLIIIIGVVLAIVLPITLSSSSPRVETYTITYNLDGGSNSSENPISYNSETGEITLRDATKKGYTFEGWYIDNEYKTKFSSEYLTGNITLYAKFSIITYQITYNLNGGINDESNPTTYNVETSTIVFAPAYKTYHIFEGWYLEDSFKTKITEIELGSTGDISLYAKYEALRFTVTYETFGGTAIESETQDAGLKFSRPDDPKKSGYIFGGWYLDSELTIPYSFDTLVTDDITLYAKWNEGTYTITWLNEDGTILTTSTVLAGEIPSLEGPAKAKTAEYTYYFNGWSPAIIASNSNATYTATYTAVKNKYSASFITLGGSTIDSETLEYGSEFIKPTTNPTKKGYTFKGWYLDSSYEKEAAFPITVENNINIYAKWEVIDYTITYNLDGGVNSSDNRLTYTVNDEFDLADATKDGYIFGGWYTDSNLSNIIIDIDKNTSGDLTLYAKWNTDLYTIVWLDSDNETILGVTNVALGGSPEFSDPTKASDAKYTYTFKGFSPEIVPVTKNAKYTASYDKTINEYTVTWQNYDGTVLKTDTLAYGATPVYTGETPTKSATETYSYTFKGFSPEIKDVNGDITYTAIFDEVYVNYLVEFLNYDGTKLYSNYYHYGQKVNVPTNAKRESDLEYTYTFKGWDKTITSAYKDETYTALFDKVKNTITIKYDTVGGSVISDAVVDYNTVITRPENPTKLGYKFLGWYTTSSYDSEYLFNSGATFSMTLYAKWEIITYTITYNLSEGTNSDNPTSYNVLSSFKINEATKDNYNFGGWYTDSALTKPISYINAGTTGNLEIYAKWNLNLYTVTFLDDDNTVIDVKTYSEGDTPSIDNPTKASTDKYTYTFTSWTPALSTVSANATYKAVYSKAINKYTVTFISDGASVILSTKYDYDSKVSTIAAPAKTGYIFDGWYSDSSLLNKFDFENTKVTSNITIYSAYIPDLNYKLIDNSYYSIIGINTFSGSDLIIPDTYNGIEIKEIGVAAFEGNTTIINFKSNNNLIAINNMAFRNCTNLTQVILNEGIKNISYQAFNNCSSVKSITIPSSVLYLDSEVFSGCSSLEEINLNEGIISIGSYIFKDCTSLKTLILPDSLNIIGSNAFNNCTSLSFNEYSNAYYLGNTINPYVLLVKAKDSSITSCEINTNTKLILDDAFSGCEALSNIKIPSSITSLSYGMFDNVSITTSDDYANYLGSSSNPYLILLSVKDKNIDKVIVNSNTKYIYDEAFSNCYNLESILLPKNIIYVGNSAFISNTKLTNLYYMGTVSDWCGINFTNIYSNPAYYAKNVYFMNNASGNVEFDGNMYSKVAELVIPNTITEIKKCQFVGFSDVTSITIPTSVNVIYEYAFAYMASLNKITIPSSVDVIYDYAFSNSTNLSNVYILDGLTILNDYVFNNCYNLNTILLPNTLEEIGLNTFKNTTNLSKIYFNGTVSEKNNIDSIDSLSSAIWYYFTYNGDAETNVGRWWYYSNTLIAEINNNETYIVKFVSDGLEVDNILVNKNEVVSYQATQKEGYYFEGWYLDNNYTKLYDFNTLVTSDLVLYAHFTCNLEFELSADKTYYIVTGINDKTLDVIEIPTHYQGLEVKEIKENAFKDIDTIYEIIIPDTITIINSGALSGLDNLYELVIPDSVTYLGENLLKDDINLKTLYISKNANELPKGILSGLSSLEVLSIPFVGNKEVDMDDSIMYPFGYIFGDESYINSIAIDGYYLNDGINEATYYIPANLLSVILTNTKYIPSYAFMNLDMIHNISIPNSTISVGKMAFYNATYLTNIYYDGSMSMWGFIYFENDTNNTMTSNPMVSNQARYFYTLDDYNGSYSFNNHKYSYLTDLSISKNLKALSFNYYNFSQVTFVYISDNLITINDYAFSNVSNIYSLLLPNNVCSIGNYAFNNSTSLVNITIGSAVNEIKAYAFNNCTSLETINYVGTIKRWNSIKKDKNWNNNSAIKTISCLDGDIKLS